MRQTRRKGSYRRPSAQSFSVGRQATRLAGSGWSHGATTFTTLFRPPLASFQAISTIFKLSILRPFQPYLSFPVNRKFFDDFHGKYVAFRQNEGDSWGKDPRFLTSISWSSFWYIYILYEFRDREKILCFETGPALLARSSRYCPTMVPTQNHEPTHRF